MNTMENLRRVFNVSKIPNQTPFGQTMFSDSPVTESTDGQCAQYFTSEFINSGKKEDGGSNLDKLRQVYSVCSAYTDELIYLCHTGLCMAKLLEENLSLMTCDSTVGTQSAQEMAGHFVTLWNNLSISTKKLVSNFEDEVLAALRDNIVNNHNEKNFSETNNLFVACFLAIIQVHYQFSVSMFETIVQLLSSVPGETKVPSSACMPLESALKEPLDLMASWTHSLSEMQKHLLNLQLNFSHSFCTGIKNDSYPSAIKQPSKRRWSFGGLRQSSSSDWVPKQWPAVGKRVEMDSSHIQGLWPADKESLLLPASDDLRSPSFDLTENTKRGSTDSQKSSTFASNEELQDVISLLSCQPSNPSSPTPDPSNQLSSNNGQNSLWSNTPHTSSAGFGAEQLESNKHIAHSQFDKFVSWNKAEATQPYADMRLQSLLERNAVEHTQAVKSTSWPAGTNLQQLHCVAKTSGVSSPTTFPAPETCTKESEFFMGLEFVGSDLMASVRQRRHSSGESLCRTSNPATFRTMSIDDMIAEGKCPRTSTWPLKQLSPNSSFCYGYENAGALSKSVNWATTADFPQGLPPSGFDSRNRNKMEKKYYLFGNPP
uniref:DUF4745 domain-containing protein n=1 Tax=Strigamia maritima TaxID=126957 RepID=T1JJJ8_STRMM